MYHLPGTDADFGCGQADFEGSAARLGGDDWKGPGDHRSGPETGAGTDGRLPAETAPAKEKAEASTLGPHWRFASTSQTPPFRQLPAWSQLRVKSRQCTPLPSVMIAPQQWAFGPPRPPSELGES